MLDYWFELFDDLCYAGNIPFMNRLLKKIAYLTSEEVLVILTATLPLKNELKSGREFLVDKHKSQLNEESLKGLL